MSFSKISAFAGAVAFASKVAAHGTVSGIVADGVYYLGYNPSFQYQQVAPVVVGWSIPEDQDNGFVSPSAFSDPDIICHKGATNAQTSATVAAGGKVELQWTPWPESHKGPMIDYLANCNGDCTSVDKSTLEFFKIDEAGLIDGTTAPGTWASDQMIANNNTWAITIPSDIAPGNYVLRHETIALHSAGSADGAQSYPQCINLEITGSGTAKPAGVLGTALMTATDPGILINIYQSLASYIVPGPAVYSAAGGSSPTNTISATNAASTLTKPDVTSSATISSIFTSPEIASSSPVVTSVTAQAPSPTRGAGRPISSGFGGFHNSTRTHRPGPPGRPTNLPSGPTKLPSGRPTKPTTTASAPSQISETVAPFPIFETITVVPTPAVTSPIVSSAAVSSSPANPTASSISSASTIPEDTTLNQVLSWISSFYSKYEGKEYTGESVARRHARDIVA